MPAGKRQQSAAMLYTLITFVGLFIVATTFAVVFYVEAEKYRTENTTLQSQIDELASRGERQQLGSIVGKKPMRKSWLAQMVDYFDQTVSLVVGGVPEATAVQVKVDNANQEVRNALRLAQEHIKIGDVDPNTVGLTRVVAQLKTELDNTIKDLQTKIEDFNGLQARFDDAIKVSFEKEQVLSEEKEQYYQELVKIRQDYSDLRALMEKTSDERAQTLMVQLDEQTDNATKLNQELIKTLAELETAKGMLKRAQGEVAKITGSPDREVAALEPDGKIVLIDEPAGVVHLDKGSNDRIYRGLTLAVYDRNAPIPEDGKGKAEIEVFGVAKHVSAARIIRSDKRNPIAVDDIAANLIWDSKKTNGFVVAGEFDLDNDGDMDYNAIDRIKALIERWGGKVANAVSVDTDFVILGSSPYVPRKPTFEDLETDPLANEKYKAALQTFSLYKQVQSRAEALWVPIFTYERFLYLIGYKGQASEPGAF